MTEPPSRNAILLARIVVVSFIVLFAIGVIRYGVHPDELNRLWRNVLARPSGPMTFRFFLQPAMAIAIALRDGINDARFNRQPYLWTLLHSAEKRGGRLWEGIVSTARVLILATVMDLAGQIFFLGTFHPNESVLVAVALAFVPYALLRGPVSRIARRWYQARE